MAHPPNASNFEFETVDHCFDLPFSYAIKIQIGTISFPNEYKVAYPFLFHIARYHRIRKVQLLLLSYYHKSSEKICCALMMVSGFN